MHWLDDLQITCRHLRRGHVPGGSRGAWHQRPHSALIWIRSGKIQTWIRGEAKPFVRPPGSVALFPPNTMMRSEFPPEGCTYTSFGFSCQLAGSIELFSLYRVPVILPAVAAEGVRQALTRLTDLAPPESPSGQTAAELAVEFERREICWRILRLILGEAEDIGDVHRQMPDGRLLAVCSYLAENYRADFDLQKCLEIACLSRAQFFRRFKRLTGVPPREFLMRLRLNEAERLLANAELSIHQVAELSGWSDEFHLSRRFRQAFGLSPTRYRKLPT